MGGEVLALPAAGPVSISATMNGSLTAVWDRSSAESGEPLSTVKCEPKPLKINKMKILNEILIH